MRKLQSIGILLLMFLSLLSFTAKASTFDSEDSFSVDLELPPITDMIPGDSINRIIQIHNQSDQKLSYYISEISAYGDREFMSMLTFSLGDGENILFSGVPLDGEEKDEIEETVIISQKSHEDKNLIFNLTLDKASIYRVAGKSCTIEITLTGFVTDDDMASQETTAPEETDRPGESASGGDSGGTGAGNSSGDRPDESHETDESTESGDGDEPPESTSSSDETDAGGAAGSGTEDNSGSGDSGGTGADNSGSTGAGDSGNSNSGAGSSSGNGHYSTATGWEGLSSINKEIADAISDFLMGGIAPDMVEGVVNEAALAKEQAGTATDASKNSNAGNATYAGKVQNPGNATFAKRNSNDSKVSDDDKSTATSGRFTWFPASTEAETDTKSKATDDVRMGLRMVEKEKPRAGTLQVTVGKNTDAETVPVTIYLGSERQALSPLYLIIIILFIIILFLFIRRLLLLVRLLLRDKDDNEDKKEEWRTNETFNKNSV